MHVLAKQERFTRAIAFLKELVHQRMHALAEGNYFSFNDDWEQELEEDPIYQFIKRHHPVEVQEYIIILLALAPHLHSSFFEPIIFEHFPNGGDFPEFGGVKGSNHRGMLPTGETAQFLLAGNDIDKRLKVQLLFRSDHWLAARNVLYLEQVKEGEPVMSGRIILSQEWIEKLLFGKETPPRFGIDFPARHIVTGMEWEDLVLHPHTLDHVNDIRIWMKHHHSLMQDKVLARKIKPGYRILFHGPSGTGKTLTATLLGKQFNKDVYRIDLSQVVSKYIGETEKNLEKVFNRAEHRDWILFFDEADSLFGKRTNVQSSHDKYANQEVAYLLQRVEDFPGLIILASNFKNNLDDAFLRRFHSVVHFPMPNANERLMLWKISLPEQLLAADNMNLIELAEKYELSGAAILNVVQYAALKSYSRNDAYIQHHDLVEGIRKEFRKEERSI